ncbi:acetylglutamate kinase [Paralimibaculum aggregatum]|uniref:Acetylglutamate kinase n=2 Tax=Paralimibaculum aggregatum TaxID=3036245 RepID=A0ABQ6LGC7_9RHOB|nr:acetylglutamate kinase [Limibaculum sp. NKW23]
MGDETAMARFARDIVLMKQCGVNPVVVHGGGPQINEMLTRLGVKSEFASGLRITTAEMVEVVEMVLAGVINKRIVAAINGQGGRAVGLSGKDAHLMVCRKATATTRDPDSHIEQVLDLGFVGEPVRIDPSVLHTVLQSELIPVVAPIGAGETPTETFNVNGDTAAGALAAALKAERLLLLTDTEGVKDKAGTVLTRLTAEDIARLMDDGTIAGGMIPKVRTALAAVEGGVGAAVILDGRAAHAVLLELFTEHGAGTLIVD